MPFYIYILNYAKFRNNKANYYIIIFLKSSFRVIKNEKFKK